MCDLDDVIGMVQASTQIQEQKMESLERIRQKTEEFVEEAVRIDEDAAEVINQNKENFYNKYNYLKPDAEKSDWEEFWDDAAEWCKEHWQEIVTTVGIIVGAALAIAAVVMTGGAALIPLLSTLLTALGVSAGTAMTVATIMSFSVAAIAVVSTIGASALNIIDTWGNIDDPAFNTWQSVLNWTSIISNGLYSIGAIYNGIKGITNEVLRNYSSNLRNGAHMFNAEDLQMSQTVQNHMYDIIKKGSNAGKLSRPYIDSNGTTLLLKEIMESSAPVSDTILPWGFKWAIEGTFRGSTGIWELVVDISRNMVVHFNFVA